MRQLPAFETLRATAYGLLGDAEDWLRSDWQPATQPTPAQLTALRQARTHIARAKAALNRAVMNAAPGTRLLIEVDWRSRAACRSVDPEMFFPTAEDGPEHAAQVAVAKAVCARCPVRVACLDEALLRIPYGIAGGLTPEERRGRRGSDETRRAERVLERGLRPGASRPDVAAAGRLLLTAGRPVAEVAARCGVTERTAARWAASTGPPTDTSTSTAARGGTGKDRGCRRALPQISHPNAQPRTPAAEGARA